MTTYGAWDAGLPCKNPNCKSHGKPHPNCKCYGGHGDEAGAAARKAFGKKLGAKVAKAGHKAVQTAKGLTKAVKSKGEAFGSDVPNQWQFAHGGEVTSNNCAYDYPHHPDCQYFQSGGSVNDILQNIDIPEDTKNELRDIDKQVEESRKPAEQNLENVPLTQPEQAPTTAPETQDATGYNEYISPEEAQQNTEQSYEDQYELPEPETQQKSAFDQIGADIDYGTAFGHSFIGGVTNPAIFPLISELDKKLAEVTNGGLDLSKYHLSNEEQAKVMQKFPLTSAIGNIAGMATQGAAIAGASAMIGTGAAMSAATAAAIFASRVANSMGNDFVENYIEDKPDDFDFLGSAAMGVMYNTMGAVVGHAIAAPFKVAAHTIRHFRSFAVGASYGGQYTAEELAQKLPDLLTRMKAGELGKFNVGAFERGVKWAMNVSEKAMSAKDASVQMIGNLAIGNKVGAFTAFADYIAKYATKWGLANAGPAVIRALESKSAEKVSDVAKYVADTSKGIKIMKTYLTELVQGTPSKVFEFPRREQNRERVIEWCKRGGPNDDIQKQLEIMNSPPTIESKAKGGLVERRPHPKQKKPVIDDHLAWMDGVYDAKKMAYVAAQGRIYQYLKSKEPQEYQPKLMFDGKPDLKKQKQDFHNAIDIAVTPGIVLSKIQKGTLKPQDVADIKALHPEYYNASAYFMQKAMIELAMQNKKPKYQTMQALSLYLGGPVISSLKSQSISAVQQVFAAQKQASQQAPQGGGKAKSNPKSLSKSDNAYMTSNQSLVSRQQNAKG